MIQSLRLQHFRSYKDESYEFDVGVNIIVGPNASGKTNLLEGILVSCIGTSYRCKDNELISFKAPWARLDAHAGQQNRTIKLIINNNGSMGKQFEIDGHKLSRLPLARTLPVVLFEPSHLQLLNGPPELRRNFLDDLLEQTVVGYDALRRQYRRALAQRNALLKKGLDQARQQLFAWNIRLSELGGQIAAERLRLIGEFNQGISKHYSQLANKRQRVTLKYQASCDPEHYATSLLKHLEHHLDIDMVRGFTTHGPHRDDLVIVLNNKPAASSASRGETRTLLLSLKLLELQLIENSRQMAPILLLDDVFSELDGARRHALTDVLSGHQSFITTTDADVVVQHFMSQCRIIPTAS